MTTNPSSPREALARTLATFADKPDTGMAVVATRNQPVRGAVTGLTWGDLRALAAEAGTAAASTALSHEYLAEIAARAEAATAGPWGFYDGDNYADVAADLKMTGRGSYSCRQQVARLEDESYWRQQVARLEDESYWEDPAHEDDDEEPASEQMAADAAFIAHAREDVPALVAEVKRLRAELADRPTRAEVLRQAAPEMDAIAHEYGVFGVGSRLRQLADAAEAGESR
ncbi:hypothetical protein ACGF0C_07600 [Streptomyces albidoflavus]